MSILITGGAGYIGSHTFPDFAKEVLNWEAKRTIDKMCADSWKWQSLNPDGYDNNFEKDNLN